MWTDFEGRQHVGTLAADPFGGPFPVVDFGDGTHGRNGTYVDLLEYEPPTLTEIAPMPAPQWSELWYSTPCLARYDEQDCTYTCTLDRGHNGHHSAVDTFDGEVMHEWPGTSSTAGLSTLRGAL